MRHITVTGTWLDGMHRQGVLETIFTLSQFYGWDIRVQGQHWEDK